MTVLEREVDRDFEAVFHGHYERIARVIARVVGEHARAEELAVEVFCRLWRNPPATGENVGGWLYRTAVRMGLYELRRERRRAMCARWLRFARPLTPEELHATGELAAQVRRVLAAMNARSAELLVLRSQDLSYAEMAEALRLNPASVGTLMRRAQEAFRKEYVRHYGKPR